MKSTNWLAALGVLAFAACNSPEPAAPATTTEAPSAMPALPYQLNHDLDNWKPGKFENVAVVMNSLKAWEVGNGEETTKGFADSVEIEFDGLEAKLSNDSLRAMMMQYRNSFKDVKIRMQDAESVVSKDGNSEYVSLWYVQIVTDMTGKVDSMDVMDDCRMKDGKIVSLSEKTRHYAKK